MVELSLKNERYRRSETLSGSGKQECIYPLFSRRTKKSAVTLIDTAFQPTQFWAGLAGGAAPSGAVPSGGLFVTGTVTVTVTVSVTVTACFAIVCLFLLVFVCFCLVAFWLPFFAPPFLPASALTCLIFSHFSLQLEAEQIRFLRFRAIKPRTNHEQRTNKEKELGRKFVLSQL